VDVAEIVEREMQRQCCFQIAPLFGERIRQSCQSAHHHTHRQVLPLNKSLLGGRPDSVRVLRVRALGNLELSGEEPDKREDCGEDAAEYFRSRRGGL